MWRWIVFRLALFAFIIWASITVFSLLIEKNKIDRNQSTEPSSVSDKKDEFPPKDITFEDITFPKNFFFGTASSDFQTTGGNGQTDWNKYADSLKPPLVGPGSGTDFLSRYREDFDLAEQFNDQVHRLSLEWARIEPEEGKFDRYAIEKYKELFLYMRSRNIEPMVCLNHFALPIWFAEKGGWESPEAAFYYSRYAQEVAEKLGKPLKIKWWLTFNEPQVMLLPYTKGNWPPNKPIKNIQDQEGVQRALKV